MSQYIGNFAKLCDLDDPTLTGGRDNLVEYPQIPYFHRRRKRHHHSLAPRRRYYSAVEGGSPRTHLVKRTGRLLFPHLARDQRKHLMFIISLVLMTSVFTTVSLVMWMTSGRH